MTACTQLTILRISQNIFLSLQNLEVRNHWEIWAQFPPHEILQFFNRQRHFSEWNFSGNNPVFFMQKMKRKWSVEFWNQSFPHSLQIEYVEPISFGFEMLAWRSEVRPVFTGLAGRGDTRTERSRCIILELQWISLFLSNIIDHPAATKLGNTSNSWRGGIA